MPTITFDKQPPSINATNYYCIYVIEADATSLSKFKFKYIYEINADSSLKAKIKAPKNAQDKGIFDVHKIVQSLVQLTLVDANDSKPIHLLPYGTSTAKPFSQNDNTLKKITIDFGVEYADAETDAPTEYLDLETKNIRFIPATQQIDVGVNASNQPEFIYDNYKMDSATDKFLSNAPTTQFIKKGQYHTIAWLNSNTLTGGTPLRIYVKVYDAGGSVLNTSTYFENTNANGGANPSTEANTESESLIFFGCGTQNLATQTLNTDVQSAIQNANVSYYEIYADNGSGTAQSSTYRFVITDGKEITGNAGNYNYQRAGCLYDTMRIGWQNTFGTYDYFNFQLKNKKKIKIRREEYKQITGDYNASTFTIHTYEGGRKISHVNAQYEYEIQTDFISEENGALLQYLFTSNYAFLFTGTNGDIIQPIIITDNTYEIKEVENGQLIQYTLKFELAHDINTSTNNIG